MPVLDTAPARVESRSVAGPDDLGYIFRHRRFRRFEVVGFAPDGFLYELTLEDRSSRDTLDAIVAEAAAYLRARDAGVA